MAIDRTVFFSSVRVSPFGRSLAQGQVDGLNVLLDAVPADLALEQLAYCLATAFHETARTMQPIAEYGRGRGRAYGEPDPRTGRTYYGRGYVQLTWRANYDKAGKKLGLDLVNEPDLAMRPAVAGRILFQGMTEGWFTGKRLSDYFASGAGDPVNARRIVNGTDRAALIAGHYRSFLAALRQAASAVPASPSRAAAVGKPSAWDRLRSLFSPAKPQPLALFSKEPTMNPILPFAILDLIRTAVVDASKRAEVAIPPEAGKQVAQQVAEEVRANPRFRDIEAEAAPKPWHQSTAIWGSLVTAAASALGIFGITVEPDLRDSVIGLAVPFATFVGAALAAYGRLNATRPIG